MAETTRKPLTIGVRSDTSHFTRGMRRAQRQLGKFGDSVRRQMRRIGTVGAAGIGAAAAAATSFALDMDNARASIGRATGAVGDELSKQVDAFSKVAGNVPDDMGTVAAAFGDLRTFMRGSNDEVATLTEQLADFARVSGGDLVTTAQQFGAAMNTWEIDAAGASAAMDTLTAVTQDFGIPAESLGKYLRDFGQLFNVAGFSIDETATIMGQFHKQGIKISRVGPAINMFLRRMADAGKDGKAELQSLVTELDAMLESGDNAAALARATEAVGAEGAVRLVSAIQGGLDISDDALAAFSENAAGRLEQTTEATTTFGDRLKEVMNKVKVQVGKALLPVLDRLAKFVSENWEKWLEKGKEIWKRVREIALAIGKWLAPHAKKLAGIIKDLVKRFADFVKKIVEWVKANPDKAMTILKLAIMGLVAAFAAFSLVKIVNMFRSFKLLIQGISLALKGPGLIGIIIALAAAAVYAYNNFEPFRNVIDAIGRAFMRLIGWFTDTTWQEKLETIGNLLSWIFLPIPRLLWKFRDEILGLLSNLGGLIVDKLAEFGNLLFDTLIAPVRDFFVRIGEIFTDEFAPFITGIPGKILGWLESVATGLYDVGTSLLGKIWSGFIWLLETYFVTIPTKLGEWIADIATKLYDVGKDLLGEIWSGFIWLLETYFVTIPAKLGEWIGKIATGLYDVGKDLLGEIWDGVWPAMRSAFWETPVRLGKWIAGIAGSLWTLGKDLVLEILPGWWTTIRDMISGLPAALWDGVKKIAGELWNIGKQIADNIVGGLKSVLKKIPLVGDVIGGSDPDGNTARVAAIQEEAYRRQIAEQMSQMSGGGETYVGARGGVVTRPVRALIGERGPEMVVPLSRAPGASPLPDGAGAGGGQQIVVNVYGDVLDEQRLGQIVYDALRTTNRLQGPLDISLRTAS